MEEVIAAEGKAGNHDYETDDSDSDETTIKFDNLTINGKAADIEYIFKQKLSKFAVISPLPAADPQDEEMSDEELKKKYEAFSAQYHNVPDEIDLGSIRLVEGNIYFQDVTDEGSAEILKILTDKYGKPIETDGSYSWRTDRTEIYYDGSDYVSYNAQYNALKKYIKTNKASDTDGL
ncbi:unnamed protein product [Aphanomyces euteiches]